MEILDWRNPNKRDGGYVECECLNTHILCNFGQHYKAILHLCSMFFGTNNLKNKDYTKEQVQEFIKNKIIVESNCSTIESIISDFYILYDNEDWKNLLNKL